MDEIHFLDIRIFIILALIAFLLLTLLNSSLLIEMNKKGNEALRSEKRTRKALSRMNKILEASREDPELFEAVGAEVEYILNIHNISTPQENAEDTNSPSNEDDP